MGIRRAIERITKPVEEDDREKLMAFRAEQGTIPIALVPLRKPVRVSGQVQVLRIEPRAGAPSLEATVSDGNGSLVAIFLGRKKITGISNGRRLILEGVVWADGPHRVMLNPSYTLLG